MNDVLEAGARERLFKSCEIARQFHQIYIQANLHAIASDTEDPKKQEATPDPEFTRNDRVELPWHERKTNKSWYLSGCLKVLRK